MRKPDYLKQPDLVEALAASQWTQRGLAKAVGISSVYMGDIINLKRRPSQEHQDAIQRAFGERGVYIDVLSIWPEHPAQQSDQTPETSKTITVEELIVSESQANQQALRETLRNETLESVQKAIKTLPQNQQYVINMRYGLSSGRTDTLESIGKDLGRTRALVGLLEQKALRRLRHPKVYKKLLAETDYIWN